MTSPARIAANRRNALKSTGPRTPEGKRASSANALKHGLCAERVVVAGEDAAEFKEFAAGMTADLDPVGATETFLCRKIVASAWRLRRAIDAEAALFEPNDDGGADVHRLPLGAEPSDVRAAHQLRGAAGAELLPGVRGVEGVAEGEAGGGGGGR